MARFLVLLRFFGKILTDRGEITARGQAISLRQIDPTSREKKARVDFGEKQHQRLLTRNL
ncbi:hypothetical protein BAR1_06810 [Profundibacter amoris]|uniref:Uncharacterized protein n=1 Tax=Profundibacter amoris TaxID=2171755 RepID=A0A347UFN7_9RHOB|nr:hypothetical protein BAR1_06810 [Profundibacter amoris]